MVVVVVPYLWCIALSCLQASVTPKGSRTRIRGLICIAVGLMLTAAAARAEEVTIVSGMLGPEGPLFVDGNLYFVAWTSGTLSKWDGKNTTVLNSQRAEPQWPCAHEVKDFLPRAPTSMARSELASRASSCAAGTPMTSGSKLHAASTTT